MKKYLLLTLLILLCLPTVSAEDLFRLELDNASNVVVEIDDKAVEIHNGMNSFDIPARTYVRVKTVGNNVFTAVDKHDDYFHEVESWMNRVEVNGTTQYVDLFTSFPADDWFSIKTSGSSETLTASATFTVDRPDQITATLDATGSVLELTPGDNTFKFDPVNDNKLTITPKERQPYLVEHNGVTVTAPYAYSLTIADGDSVKVQWLYPDVDCVVTLDLGRTDINDFIFGITADGKDITGWNGGSFTVKSGTTISMRADTKTYEVKRCTVNGESEMFTSPFNLLITGDTEIAIEAAKYDSFPVTLNIDDPDAVVVYRGYANNGDIIALKAGQNEVEIARAYPFISVRNNFPKYLRGCTFAGNTYEDADLKGTIVQIGYLADYNTVNLTTATLARDNKAVIYLGGSRENLKLTSSVGIDLDGLADGYNDYSFDLWETPLTIDARGPESEYVYLDGELQPSVYESSQTYELDLAHGNVVKIFKGQKPDTHSVSVKADSEAAKKLTMTVDHANPCEIADQTLSVLSGTHITLAGDFEGITVKADGNDVPAAENGTRQIEVNKDCQIEISSDTSGIDDIVTGTHAAPATYNLQGIRVSDDRLTPGIYIRGGKKIRID